MKDELPIILKIVQSEESREVKGIAKFFQKIGGLFKQTTAREMQLSGRIQELSSSIDEILDQLITFKDFAKNEFDEELFTPLDAILSMLIRESLGFRKTIEMSYGASMQVKMIKRYAEWLDKAKRWSDLANQKFDREVIYRKVIDHTIEDFYLRIDRDIQVLNEYITNSIDQLPAENCNKEELRGVLQEKLTLHFRDLARLREIPTELPLSLKEFSIWRTMADQSRGKTFAKSLHLIDECIERISVPHIEEEEPKADDPPLLESIEKQKTVKIEKELKSLEEKLEELIQSLEKSTTSLKGYAQDLNSLETHAHRLNGDLRLSEIQIERVELALETLSTLRDRIE